LLKAHRAIRLRLSARDHARSVDWDERKKAGVCEDDPTINSYKLCLLANAQCGHGRMNTGLGAVIAALA
jgi:hypothetical protein